MRLYPACTLLVILTGCAPHAPPSPSGLPTSACDMHRADSLITTLRIRQGGEALSEHGPYLIRPAPVLYPPDLRGQRITGHVEFEYVVPAQRQGGSLYDPRGELFTRGICGSRNGNDCGSPFLAANVGRAPGSRPGSPSDQLAAILGRMAPNTRLERSTAPAHQMLATIL